ncbi:hypothetical protein ASG87_01360 [Frateuria sp. Soil773]|nr:hypothetical protein ASG87_01360 [Frateuria sp. Soil773]
MRFALQQFQHCSAQKAGLAFLSARSHALDSRLCLSIEQCMHRELLAVDDGRATDATASDGGVLGHGLLRL